jgi:hypothetical protein
MGLVSRFRIVSAMLAVAAAGETIGSEAARQTLERKLQLAEVLLGKLDEPIAAELSSDLAELRRAADTGKPEALTPEVDELVRRASEAYRNREGRAAVVEQRYRDRYVARLAEVERYKEGFDALVDQRGKEAAAALDQVSFEKRLRRAEELAEGNRYAAAYPVLDGAYHQLLSAIKHVRDRETVEYRLEFLVPKDEYEYEQRRYRGHLTLIDLTLQESPQPGQRGAQIDQLMREAAAKHDQASALAAEERYKEALLEEEAAAKVLTGVLRRLGYFF